MGVEGRGDSSCEALKTTAAMKERAMARAASTVGRATGTPKITGLAMARASESLDPGLLQFCAGGVVLWHTRGAERFPSVVVGRLGLRTERPHHSRTLGRFRLESVRPLRRKFGGTRVVLYRCTTGHCSSQRFSPGLSLDSEVGNGHVQNSLGHYFV